MSVSRTGDPLRVSDLVQLTEDLAAAPDDTIRAQVTVDSAVRLLDRCDGATFTTGGPSGVITEARSGRLVRRADVELRSDSVVSHRVHTGRQSYGTLNLCAHGSRFDEDDMEAGRTLARLLAVSMTSAREIDQLRTALGSRLVIGRAEGILMERLGIDADQSFAYLRRVSMDCNRKLVDIAEEVARTGRLPGRE